MSTPTHPLMPKATAVWLVDNTSLSFDQIAQFCGMHLLEIKGIADGDVAQGVRGKSPITSGELSRDEISRAEEDADYRLKLLKSKVKIPEIKTKKRPRYTPVSRRQDRPNAVLWLLRHHGELRDSQIMRLVGTTKPTIGQIRDRSHWNSANLVPQDPVMLGLCSQVDLDSEVEKAAKRVDKERKAMGLPPLEASDTLLPTAETTGYETPGQPAVEEPAPTAENIFGAVSPREQAPEDKAEAAEAARVFAKLQDIKSGEGEEGEAGAEASEAAAAPETAEEAPVAEADTTDDASEAASSSPFADLAALATSATEQPTVVDKNQAHLDAVAKYVPEYDEATARAIIRHLGIALMSKDASLVACSSKDELERVRESWCKKKLGLEQSDDELDAMIKEICETMKADHQKNRVAFYYLLAVKSDKLSVLTS